MRVPPRREPSADAAQGFPQLRFVARVLHVCRQETGNIQQAKIAKLGSDAIQSFDMRKNSQTSERDTRNERQDLRFYGTLHMCRHVKETTDKREKGEKERANNCDASREGHLVAKFRKILQSLRKFVERGAELIFY